jgi:8-oxo-dGTP pyrophosphatase MutT (NUDIX family)
VKTRAGRWTFPKGRVENDFTRAAAAAREAVEEAGAYVRVDFHPFTRYVHAKNPEWNNSPQEHLVDAHLCEVIDRGAPEEDYRNPTWFSVERSKLRLNRKRSSVYGKELAKVVDRAIVHILRRHTSGDHRQ